MASLAVLVFHAPLLDGGVPSGFDVVNEKLFWRAWTFDRLRRGELPLWNPHVLCGYPMHADPVQAVFYPLEWIHLVLPHPFAIGLSFALAGLIACWGTERLARLLGADAWGSALAGVAYATSGLVAGHVGLGEIPHLQSMAWTPWCLALALEVLGGRRQSLPWLAMVTALAVLAGHVQYAYQTLVATAIVCATALAWMTPRRLVLRRVVTQVAPAIALGLTLTCITLVPALSYVSHSNRGGGLDWMATTTGAIHPFELVRLVVPDFFGDAITTPYWGGFVREMSAPYVGIATLAAIPWAFRSWRVRRGATAILPMMLLGLAVAFSAYTPIHRWLFHALPGFAFFRMPVRWLHLTTLGLAILGGLGLGRLGACQSADHRSWPDWACAAILPAVLAAGAALLFAGGDANRSSGFERFETAVRARVDSFIVSEPGEAQAEWRAGAPSRYAGARDATLRALGLALACGLGVIAVPRSRSWIGPAGLALASIDLITSGQRYLTTVPESSLETPPALRSVLSSEPGVRTLTLVPGSTVPRPPAFDLSYPGFNRFSQSYIHRSMTERRRDVGGVFFVVASAYRALAGVESSFEHETVEDPPILDLLGVRWVLAPTGRWPSEKLLETDFTPRAEMAGLRVLENPRRRPRVFLARTIEVTDELDAARARLLAPDFPSDGVVLIAEDVADAGLSPESLASVGFAPGEASIASERDEQLTIQVESSRATLLVVADAYDPGWRASIDGVAHPVLRADLALRAVPVPAGTHEVVLAYRPRPLLYGAAFSALGALGWVGLWLRLRREPARGVR